jgi:Ala-tRNA(Pro) deacylase
MDVQDFLRIRKIQFDVLHHRPTYDAQRLASALAVSGCDVAKTVLLRNQAASQYAVAVLPAARRIDLDLACQALGWQAVQLAGEAEITQHCPDCEWATLPPFGSKYGMQTLVEASFDADQEIVFEGANHGEAIRMRFEDYRQVEQPLVAAFAVRQE